MRRKEMKKKLAVVFSTMFMMTTVLSMTSVAFATETEESAESTASTGIVVDGKLDDWAAMGVTSANELTSLEMKYAFSEDGSMLYFYYAGPAVSEWDGSYDWKYLQFTFGDTTTGMHFNSIADYWMNPGAEVARLNTANGNNPGIIVFEGALPVTSQDFTISFEGTTIASSDIPTFVPAEEVEAVYEGITIDGDYFDWAAVAKTEAGEVEDSLNSFDCLSEVACIFDGDYVYVYLKDGETGTAAGAGEYSNGRFSIVTDTGRTLTFEVNAENGGSVAGVEGATAAYFGDEWEIAIPASALPLYVESFSFGLYQQEPFVSDIVNLQGGTGTAGEFSGIVYDGLYGDWNAYPHTLIHYGTAGTQTNSPDGEGALYTEDGIVYGHVISSMDAHLAEDGGEFASAVSIYFNGEHDYNYDRTNNLYPALVAVTEDGTIIWDPQTEGLENGTYEFYIMDARMEFDRNLITNVSQLAEHEQFFGRMFVTVSDTNDEIEFFIDLEQVAKYLSYYSGTTIEASDFQLIEAQFGRIGQEIISTAGTSSGPAMGIAVCIAVVAVAYFKKRRNNKAVA